MKRFFVKFLSVILSVCLMLAVIPMNCYFGFDPFSIDVNASDMVSDMTYRSIYHSYIKNKVLPSIGVSENYRQVFYGISERDIINKVGELKGLSSVFIEDFNNDNIPEMITVEVSVNDEDISNVFVKLYSLDSSMKVVYQGLIYETDKFDNAGEEMYVFVHDNNNQRYLCITDHYCAVSTSSSQVRRFMAFKINYNNDLVLAEEIICAYGTFGRVTVTHNDKTVINNSANDGGPVPKDFISLTEEIDRTFDSLGLNSLTWSFGFGNSFPGITARKYEVFSCGTKWRESDSGVLAYLSGNYDPYDYAIAVLTTERSLTVELGDRMDIAFGLLENGKFDEKWKKMAIVVSDPSIISLSNYEVTDYGYSIQVTGKKCGSTNVVITDTLTGLNTDITITVSNSYVKSTSYIVDNVSMFYPNNKWENHISTNIYNLNGLYVNKYSCKKTDNAYNVSFDVYNSLHHSGSIDVFDKNGNWVSSEKVEKFSNISSLWDTGEQAYYLISDLFTGKLITYEQASFAKRTHIEITVPDGGYFTISNNFAESVGTFLYNSCEIIYKGASNAIDLITTSSLDVSSFSELIANEITDSKVTRELFYKTFIETADQEIRNYTKSILDGNVDIAFSGLSGLFENMLSAADISWKHLFKTVTGVGESIFTALSGPAGLALKGCFAINENTDLLYQALDLARSVDKTYVTVFTANGNYINPHGVVIDTKGNIDNETVLQVFRISNNDSVEVILDSDNPLEKHELYNICFVKNDEAVQPNGKVKVHIPIPDGMQSETCKVYRQENDNSWSVLDAHIEGEYLVFETNHFSLYAVVGDTIPLEIESLPDKLDYIEGEVFDPRGLKLISNGKIIDEGFVCEPAIFTETGMKTVTVKYGYSSAVVSVQVYQKPSLGILTPSKTVINYGDTLVLNADVANLPDRFSLSWLVIGNGVSVITSEDGMECRVTSIDNGTVTVLVKVVDENGNAIQDADGFEIYDEITVTSRAGWFWKIIYFIKLIFAINRIIY